jgi:hypothetical protein
MKMANLEEGIKQMLEEEPSIRLRLGTNLINDIDNTRNKYGGRGFGIGLSLGLTIGGAIGYILSKGNAVDTFCGLFLGHGFGINFGYALGLKYVNNILNGGKKQDYLL